MELKCSNNETVLRSFDCGKNKLGHVGLTVTNKRVIATTKGSANLIKKEIPLESVKAVNFSCATDALSGTQIFLGLICIILMLGSMFACVGDLLGVNINLIKSDDIAMRILFALLAIAFLIFAILLFKRRNSICLSITQKIKNGGRQRRKISSSKKVGIGRGLAIILITAALSYLLFSLINPERGAPTLGTLLILVVYAVVCFLIAWFLGGQKELSNAQTQEDVEAGMRKNKVFGKVTASILTVATLALTIADIIIMSENRSAVNSAKGNVENIVLTAFMWVMVIIIWISVSKKGAGKSMIGAATAKTFQLNLDMKSARLLASEIGAAILDARFVAEEQSKAQEQVQEEQSQEENKTE